MYYLKANKTYKIMLLIGVPIYNTSHCRDKGLLHNSSEIIVQDFQEILQKSNLNGSILFYNPKTNKLYSNNFEWTKTGRLPTPTFKIPNTLTALESGIVENDSTILKWDGKAREMKVL